MKRIVWILLLISAVIQPIRTTSIYVLFQANRAYIASNLCDYRMEQNATCNGSCYLKKELKKDAEKKEHHTEHAKQGADIILYVQVQPDILTKKVKPAANTYPTFTANLVKGPDFPIYHPPQCMA